jgi:hypothetical protein
MQAVFEVLDFSHRINNNGATGQFSILIEARQETMLLIKLRAERMSVLFHKS